MSKQAYRENQQYVINMTTGAHGLRTEVTDTLPLTFKIIDDATCRALCRGTVKGSQVVEAIKRKFMTKPDFSWEDYDRRRQEEKLRMNVSQHDMVPVTTKDDEGERENTTSEVFSLESLGLALSGAAKDKPSGGTPTKKASGKKLDIDEALGEY
jgi:hypothetical protein